MNDLRISEMRIVRRSIKKNAEMIGDCEDAKAGEGNGEEREKRKLIALNPAATKYVGTYTLCMKRAGSLCEAFDVTYHMTGCGGR